MASKMSQLTIPTATEEKLKLSWSLRLDTDMLVIGCKQPSSYKKPFQDYVKVCLQLTNPTNDSYVIKIKSKLGDLLKTSGAEVQLSPYSTIPITLMFKYRPEILRSKRYQLTIYHLKVESKEDKKKKSADIWKDKDGKTKDPDGMKTILVDVAPERTGVWRLPIEDYF